MADPDAGAPAPPKKKARKAKMEAPAPQDLPTSAAVRKARKAELVKWLGELGESTEGRIADLRTRLLEYVKEHGKPPEPAERAPEAAPEAAAVAEEVAAAIPGPPEPAYKPAPPAGPADKPEKPEKRHEAAEPETAAVKFVAKSKPALDEAARRALGVRRDVDARRPRFLRQEWYRYARLGEKWRRPQGGQSKLRRHFGYRINVVSIGYRSPRRSRGLHPSGFVEVLVHTLRELDGADPKRQAIRVAHGVGARKRRIIQDEARKRGLRVLNPVEVAE